MRTPTLKERECQLLPIVLRYSYEHDLPKFEGTSTRNIFVAIPSRNWASDIESRSPIEMFYRDPSPEWLAAFALSGVPVIPASRATFTIKQPWYHDPKTQERVIIFAVHSIHFNDEDHARVLTSTAIAPLAGGEITLYLTRTSGVWQVTKSEYGAVY